MIIRVFGGLKDYFEPVFEIKEKINSIPVLRERLVSISPASAQLLSKCRFAVGNTIVDEHSALLLMTSSEVAVLPPSSGG